jgi:GntR family transcriptional repressor for pyruvate dehydrogenase complex
MFKQVEPVRLSDAAAAQIAQAISGGNLKVGDRIPSERELMRQLGIGRASVREALRQMQTMGVIDVRPGQGAVIINTLTQAPAAQLWKIWLSQHSAAALQLLDVREALELKATELAARLAGELDISRLTAANARLRQMIPDELPNERAEADVAFHTALFEASGNRLLITLAQSLMYALHMARVGAYTNVEHAILSADEHAAIVDAIAAHDPDLAQRAMKAHLDSSKEFLREV